MKDFPNSKAGWSLLGGVELELNDIKAAKVAYCKSLFIDPNFSNALCGMGVVSRYEKDFDKAEDYCYDALRNNQKNYLAKSSLMLLELYKGNSEIAISLGEDSIMKGIDNVPKSVIGNLAIAYQMTNQFDKRDSLIDYLRMNEYKDLYYLLLTIEGKITLDDIFELGNPKNE